MTNRRKVERMDACLDTVWEGASGRYSARITDLSEGGCYIDSMCEAYVGEQIAFQVQLPGGHSLPLTGVVAHYSPRLGFGVQFDNLANQQLKVKGLIRFLRALGSPALAT